MPDSSAPRARSGLGGGFSALWFGVGFLGQRSDLWSLAAVPVLLTLLLGTGGSIAGLYLGYHYTHLILAPHAGLDIGGILISLLSLIVGLFTAVLGALLGTSLAVPLSGSALEKIAIATRTHLGLTAPEAQGLGTFAHSLAATVVTWVVGVLGTAALFLIDVLVPVAAPVTLVLKGALLALLLTFDLGDSAFSLLGLTLSGRIGWMRSNLGAALGFGAGAALLLCVPVLGLLVLPAAVAGATSLVGKGQTASAG